MAPWKVDERTPTHRDSNLKGSFYFLKSGAETDIWSKTTGGGGLGPPRPNRLVNHFLAYFAMELSIACVGFGFWFVLTCHSGSCLEVSPASPPRGSGGAPRLYIACASRRTTRRLLELRAVPNRYSSQVEDNFFTEMCSSSEVGSYFRLIDSCITQLEARGR